MHSQGEPSLPAIDRVRATDGHGKEQERTGEDDHDEVGIAQAVEAERADQRADFEHPEEVEDIGTDDVPHRDIRIAAVGGAYLGGKLGGRRPYRNHGKADE